MINGLNRRRRRDENEGTKCQTVSRTLRSTEHTRDLFPHPVC